MTSESATRVHLGCGKRYIPGFIHIDLADFPHIQHRHAIQSLPMFADDTVDLIYCCHAFEYFDRQEAPAVLAEWLRVLRPGATLRLAVPDFAALTRVYNETADLNLVLGLLYGRMSVRGPDGDRTLYHRTAYDFTSLERVLLAAGFRAVERYDWRGTAHSSVDDFAQAYIPHMQKESGLLVSLNVEARK